MHININTKQSERKETMLDFIGTMGTTGLMFLVVAAIAANLKTSNTAKLTFAGFAGLYIGFTAASTQAGWVAIGWPFPLLGLYVTAPIVAGAIVAATPAGRSALLALPTRLLIGLNMGRILAIMFLLLAGDGRLSGPFPFYAGWGDILTGVFAFAILLSGLDVKQRPGLVMAWNLFGMADLVDAIVLGTMSQEGSLQIFGLPGSTPMQHLPWSFIPTVLVPYFLFAHGVIAAQLLQSRRAPAYAS
jgi:hypothetical protein